eukprot:gene2791-5497_t
MTTVPGFTSWTCVNEIPTSGSSLSISGNPLLACFPSCLSTVSVILVGTVPVCTTIPTYQPSRLPTVRPSSRPSARPTTRPTFLPSRSPSNRPSRVPTSSPTISLTDIQTSILCDWTNQITGSPAKGWSCTFGQPDSIVICDGSISLWSGISCDALGHIITIQLDFVSGTLPFNLGSIWSLQKLILDSNGLTGTIPSSLGDASTLVHIDLFYNRFTGKIPPSLGKLTSLKHLYLYYNSLTGPIPSTFGGLTAMEQLFLSYNSLSGSLPSEMGLMNNNYGVATSSFLRGLDHNHVLKHPLIT